MKQIRICSGCIQMADKIIILPPEIVNKIAAGEVVERPASVVKELAENSLDAGATVVEVEIKDAGKNLIRVIDNGSGMSKEDVLLCTSAHATSKISSVEDLERISTLGFRGEALSSIASVSLLRIITRTEKMDAAVELEIEAGRIKSDKEIGNPKGTTVEVRNLFFNTPARKKFLKSPATEMGHIIHIMEQFALAYPVVQFRLIHQEQELLNLLPVEDKLARVDEVLGGDLAENLCVLSFEERDFKIYGFLSKPNFSRLDRYGQFFFVNKRAIANKSLTHAVFSVYQELLPKERFPVAIVYIDINPRLVDVNVHPTKREIRFQNEKLIHDSLYQAIRNCLLENSLIPEIKEGAGNAAESFKTGEQVTHYSYSGTSQLFQEDAFFSPEISLLRKTPFLQVNNLYILTSDEEGVLIIDQHAASERIIFDVLSRGKETKEIQRLLIPEVIDLGLKESQILKENLEELRKLGFELEEFGKTSFQIKTTPAILSDKNPRQLILDIVSEIQEGGNRVFKLERERLLALIACHSAVKAGDRLDDLQVARLIGDLKNTKFPYTCPHGRPTMIRLGWEELEKKFKRK